MGCLVVRTERKGVGAEGGRVGEREGGMSLGMNVRRLLCSQVSLCTLFHLSSDALHSSECTNNKYVSTTSRQRIIHSPQYRFHPHSGLSTRTPLDAANPFNAPTPPLNPIILACLGELPLGRAIRLLDGFQLQE